MFFSQKNLSAYYGKLIQTKSSEHAVNSEKTFWVTFKHTMISLLYVAILISYFKKIFLHTVFSLLNAGPRIDARPVYLKLNLYITDSHQK